eukprot:7121701-Pyramimonas_sp.AAC.1
MACSPVRDAWIMAAMDTGGASRPTWASSAAQQCTMPSTLVAAPSPQTRRRTPPRSACSRTRIRHSAAPCWRPGSKPGG